MGAGRFRDLKTATLVTEGPHHLGNIGEIRREADVVDIGGENVVIASFQKDLTGSGADGVEMARGNELAVVIRNRPPSKEFLVDLVECKCLGDGGSMADRPAAQHPAQHAPHTEGQTVRASGRGGGCAEAEKWGGSGSLKKEKTER